MLLSTLTSSCLILTLTGLLAHGEHRPFGEGGAAFTHRTTNLTGCGETRSCGSMIAAPLVMQDQTVGMVSGVEWGGVVWCSVVPPPPLPSASIQQK
jgi:hypothetical protein